MARFSKKDYELYAGVLRDFAYILDIEDKDLQYLEFKGGIENMANEFLIDNPRFDYNRFISAVLENKK